MTWIPLAPERALPGDGRDWASSEQQLEQGAACEVNVRITY